MFYKKRIEQLEADINESRREIRELQCQVFELRQEQEIFEGFSLGRMPKKIKVSQLVQDLLKHLGLSVHVKDAEPETVEFRENKPIGFTLSPSFVNSLKPKNDTGRRKKCSTPKPKQ